MYYHENINLNNNDQWIILKFSISKKIFAKTFQSQGYIYALFYKALSIFICLSLFFFPFQEREVSVVKHLCASTYSWSFHEKSRRREFHHHHIFYKQEMAKVTLVRKRVDREDFNGSASS